MSDSETTNSRSNRGTIVLRDGRSHAIVIHNGLIQAVGPAKGEPPAQVRQLSSSGARVEPGRINAHTHIYSGLAPLGMPSPEVPPESFVQILERVWWRLDRALDEASLRASARLYVAESLLAGTTSLVDHHESPNFIEGSLDVLADACEELGMRAVVCYGATERNDGLDEAARGLEECRRFLLENRRGLVRGAFGLHAAFTVSDETIQLAGEQAGELGVAVHVHVAEDLADVRHARGLGYAGVLHRLEANGGLPRGSILAHGVHLTREEVRQVAERGCWLVQNPRSNEGNEVGYGVNLRESALVALGTDGWAAQMDEEARALYRLAADHGDDRETAARRVDAGADLVGSLFGARLGTVERGSTADLVVRDDEGVRHVIVDGRVVVADGELVGADIAEIRAEAEEQAAALWERMKAL